MFMLDNRLLKTATVMEGVPIHGSTSLFTISRIKSNYRTDADLLNHGRPFDTLEWRKARSCTIRSAPMGYTI